MSLVYQKSHTHFLLILLILASISCHAIHASQAIARKVEETIPDPSVKCDTCPEPVPPPPPPPECPPPPPPPVPCPPPPPPPEEPCEQCEAQSPPPPPPWSPKVYYSPSGPNLYQTEYGYSGVAQLNIGFVGVLMFVGLQLLQMIILV